MTNKNNKDAHDELQIAELRVDHAKTTQLLKSQEDFEKSGYTEERDIAVGLLHQAKTHNAYAKLATCASLADLIYIKENKLYRAIADYSYISPSGEKVATLPNWEGFCKAIGLSKRTVDLQIQNSKVVGIEAYEAMVSIGIGPGAFRKLRQLPEDDVTAVVNDVEINLGDKDSILDLIDGLSAKHSKEKESLRSELEESKKDLEAARKVTEGKNSKISKLEEEIHRRDMMAPDEINSDLANKLNSEMLNVIGGLRALEAVINQISKLENPPRELLHARGNELGRLLIDIDEIHSKYFIDRVELDFDDAEPVYGL